ncbi:MAG: hypothetical protein HY426_04140 [Candidatus Levybacteria bacterium]|nr:hypothetical protein [Candidatus Levybacteria bacterium]
MALPKKTIQNEITSIKNQVETDFYQVLDKTQYSFFPIPLMVFSMVDYLGSLHGGKNSSENAVRFMRTYFFRGNKAYAECAGLLYFVYRHGLTHQRIPKLTQLKVNGRKISCYITRTETSKHLSGFQMSDRKTRGIVICLKSLIDDLRQSIIEYEKDLLGDTRTAYLLRAKFSIAYSESRRFHKEKTLLTDKQWNTYVTKDDFSFIRRQLRKPIVFRS